MAAQTSITTKQELVSWLESLGFFDSVTLESDIITMKDSDSNTLAAIGSDGAIALYATGGLSASIGSHSFPWIGIKCSGGAVLCRSVSGGIPSTNDQLAISPNQAGKIIFAYHASAQGSTPYLYDISYRAVSWNDSDIGTYQTDQRVMNQTVFVPIVSRSAVGESSYCPDAFLQYATQSPTTISAFVNPANNKKYYVTGWFAFRDEGGAS